MYRQDAMFYVNTPSFEVVAKYGRYEVVRNGYMRINNMTTGDVYRYTSDLEKAGYTNDELLAEEIDNGELEIIDNPWFEVWDSENLNPDPPIVHEHRQACKPAWELAKQEIEEYVR
jgi:hypothetical protein